jgi:COP9 signalosome complex subunit 3
MICTANVTVAHDMQICLKAQHIPPAILRPILLTPITHVSTTSFPDLDYNDNLLYHYIGGIIFGLWKDWKNASVIAILQIRPGLIYR